jgi:hypothetical protein
MNPVLQKVQSMLKSEKTAAPFTQLIDAVYVKHGAADSLWQIRTDKHTGAIGILYDVNAYPNYVAAVNHNH